MQLSRSSRLPRRLQRRARRLGCALGPEEVVKGCGSHQAAHLGGGAPPAVCRRAVRVCGGGGRAGATVWASGDPRAADQCSRRACRAAAAHVPAMVSPSTLTSASTSALSPSCSPAACTHASEGVEPGGCASGRLGQQPSQGGPAPAPAATHGTLPPAPHLALHGGAQERPVLRGHIIEGEVGTHQGGAPHAAAAVRCSWQAQLRRRVRHGAALLRRLLLLLRGAAGCTGRRLARSGWVRHSRGSAPRPVSARLLLLLLLLLWLLLARRPRLNAAKDSGTLRGGHRCCRCCCRRAGVGRPPRLRSTPLLRRVLIYRRQQGAAAALPLGRLHWQAARSLPGGGALAALLLLLLGLLLRACRRRLSLLRASRRRLPLLPMRAARGELASLLQYRGHAPARVCRRRCSARACAAVLYACPTESGHRGCQRHAAAGDGGR